MKKFTRKAVMAESDDTKNRLNLIEETCKKDIASKEAEIKNKQQELHEKQHVSGITKEQESQYSLEIGKFQYELKCISNNQVALSKLSNAICMAFDEVNEWSPGLTAAIEVIEQYSKYLKGLNGIDTVVTQCSRAMNLLTEDIKNYSSDKGVGSRIISALQGVGLALAGVVLGILAVPATLLIAGVNDVPGKMWAFVGNFFVKAFDQFKQTWTGKVEPPALKKLSHDLNAIHEWHRPAPTAVKNPNAFYAEKPSSGSSLDSINEEDLQQTTPKSSH